MSVFNSIGKEFVVLVVVILVVGLLAGLLMSNTDLANFIRNSAEAEKQRVVNQYQSVQNQIDLDNYRIKSEAQNKVEVEKIGAEAILVAIKTTEDERVIRAKSDAEIARINDKRSKESQWDNAWIEITRYFGIALSIGLGLSFVWVAVYLTVHVARHIPASLPQTTANTSSSVSAVSWSNPSYRAQRIIEARKRELEDRKKFKPIRQIEPVCNEFSGNGRRQETLSEN